RDGAIDRLYFADVKGNVWRVELDTDLTDTDSDTSSLYDLADAKLIKFADFSGITDDTTEYRKFFSEPDVSIIRTGTSQSLLISLGSGDRTRPLDTDVTNRFYVLKDEHLYSPLPENFETITDEDTGDDSDLLAVTISNSENGIAVDNPITAGGIFKSDKKGWYLNFGSEGEKVLADSTTSHGKVLFTTIVPNVYANSESGVNCNLPEIQGRAYVINILTGASMVDLSGNGGNPNNNDLYTIISANEIPGNIQVIFNEPSASDGGQCTAANCVQYVDLRIGKKRSQITSYNSGILESVYWSQSQGQ
ncbi:MAG: hypothetical protein KAH03_07310, partial [Cocleimonas sp.]|nr:hypothetical protein [Cocleimonas sp.]